MANATFPVPVSEVISTLAELFRHQGRMDVVELLDNANPSVALSKHDDFNSGDFLWALHLRIPVEHFAKVEPNLPGLEKKMVARLAFIGRLHTKHVLYEVTIAPLAPGKAVLGVRFPPSELQVRRLWPAGRFRLFLSHTSFNKVAVAKLKAELALRGIAAFVAHEDIEPSSKWQEEIELGLRSMHALAALLTPDFHASLWTDQELGWALGRGIPIIPILYGIKPYGLAGKFQGIAGDFGQSAATASAILNALVKNELSQGEMRRALFSAFCASESFLMTQAMFKEIKKLNNLAAEEIAALRRAFTDNKYVAEAYNVADAFYLKYGRPPVPGPAQGVEEDVPF